MIEEIRSGILAVEGVAEDVIDEEYGEEKTENEVSVHFVHCSENWTLWIAGFFLLTIWGFLSELEGRNIQILVFEEISVTIIFRCNRQVTIDNRI